MKFLKRLSKFEVLITIILAVLALIIQHLYYLNQEKVYLEQQVPDVDCFYEYYAEEDMNKFYIKNTGLVDCQNVWIEERIFAIVDSNVYEGEDVPRFNYLIYKGSRTRMWNLPKESKKYVKLEKLQHIAFLRLTEKFKAKLISKWQISFSGPYSSKRYQVENYFLHDVERRIPQNLRSYTGGEAFLNLIRNYSLTGNKNTIKIFDLTEDFELNTPSTYFIKDDYSIIPLYPWTTLSIEEMNHTLGYRSGLLEPLASDDVSGTISYGWDYKDGKWSKMIRSVSGKGGSTMYSKPYRTPFGYLNSKDAEVVRNNLKLLKYLDPERKPVSAERMKEIENKARMKFLEDSQYRK